MTQEHLIYSFILIFPLLLVLFLLQSYSLYMKFARKQRIVKLLAGDSNKLLSENKIKIDFSGDQNMFKQKLTYAGFSHPSAWLVFLFISAGFGALSAIFINIVLTSPIVLLISATIFSFFPMMVLEKIIASRQEEFNFGLKGIIDKTVSMMKSGVGFEQALKKSILTSRSKFTKEIFEIYMNEKEIIGEEKAFSRMFKLVESKELRIFYLVVSIGRESGGKFSNTLETLRKTLHEQGTIKDEISSSTKEIKVGTYLIIAITVGMYYMLDKAFEGAVSQHFMNSTQGQVQLFFIIIWVAFGLFVNKMMTKIKA